MVIVTELSGFLLVDDNLLGQKLLIVERGIREKECSQEMTSTTFHQIYIPIFEVYTE